MKLSLAALPLRTRLDFETSRGFCGLAQNDAHHVPVRISSPSRLRSRATPTKPAIKRRIKHRKPVVSKAIQTIPAKSTTNHFFSKNLLE
ncbi:hypothetical protein ACFQHW_02350 [Lapidilactobacillus achengensis]|uniref:Uncharacterized protein n=1 Tax=Lapidilactobacillus achengensis TaxID=2486000 RepID=A0ABW1UMJ2_9LACO|nr:hypothetical protein [Lapidilactobacillus achengensis]